MAFSFLFSKKPDITTPSGWDSEMMRYKELIKRHESDLEIYRSRKRSVLIYLWISLFCFALYILNFFYFQFFTFSWVAVIALVLLLVVLYNGSIMYSYKIRKSMEQKSSDEKSMNQLGSEIQGVKACIPEIFRLMQKHGVKNPMIDGFQQDISSFIQVMTDILSMPLCKECRALCLDRRPKYISSLPEAYRSQLESVKPKELENEKLPLDMRVMRMLGAEQAGVQVTHMSPSSIQSPASTPTLPQDLTMNDRPLSLSSSSSSSTSLSSAKDTSLSNGGTQLVDGENTVSESVNEQESETREESRHDDSAGEVIEENSDELGENKLRKRHGQTKK